MDKDKLIESINKTGFILEYEVGYLFEEKGWNIINNRYYLDDVKQESREIDIIAYKVREVEDILYYTTLIISCKKSIDNTWAFLVKNMNKKDPNINLHPINHWSNNVILNFMKEKQEFETKLTNEIKENESISFTYEIEEQVFAFQQINKNNLKPQNDKDIYNSIITSIKALEYEKNSLNNRVNREALYNFNILSIFDGDMHSIKYSNSKPIVEEINHIKYLNRHIVNKSEQFFRVHFIKFDFLKNCIDYFDGLHDWHVDIYSGLKKEYQRLITEERDENAMMLLKNTFIKELELYLYSSEKEKWATIQSLKFGNSKKLKIVCEMKEDDYQEREELMKIFNNDSTIQKRTKEVLKKIYGYEGEFIFYNDALPF